MTKQQKIAAIAAAGGVVAAIWVATHNNSPQLNPEKHLLIATWNVRGYPESADDRRAWFSSKLADMSPDIICIQEIANQSRVDTFIETEGYPFAAFLNSDDGQDNAIFCAEWVELNDIADPPGFKHPVQAAFVAYADFDAVIVTLHLMFTDEETREAEKALLADVAADMQQIDPDVIIVGDFNITETEIQQLADTLGMQVMIPLRQEGVGTTTGNNRYDHFLISPDLANEEAVTCEIQTYFDEAIASQVSDHVPVLAVFDADGDFRDRP